MDKVINEQMKRFNLNSEQINGIAIMDTTVSELESSDEGKDALNRIVEFWETLGFLESFDDDENLKKRCALIFQQVTLDFLKKIDDGAFENMSEERNSSYQTIIYPMIIKILKSIKNKDSFLPRKLLEYMVTFDFMEVKCLLLERFLEKMTNLKSVDFDAESLLMVCDMISDKFDNPSKGFDEITASVNDKVNEVIKKHIKLS